MEDIIKTSVENESQKKSKIKPSVIVTAVIVLVILTVAFFGARPYIPFLAGGEESGPGSPGGIRGGAAPRIATAVRVTPVELGTIENSVVINGDVQAVNQVSIFPTVGGRISETHFNIGDTVRQGTVLAMVDHSRPGQVFSESPVISTISGTVIRTPVSRGDTVTTQTAIYVIGDLSSLMIETHVPERFSNAAQRGLGAHVFLEALPGESFTAMVDQVSPVLDPASRTVRIMLRFQGTMDPRIRAGMFATISLVTNTRENVPIIPRTSIINTYDSRIVFVVDGNNIAHRREIFLGLENEDFVEVLRGLEPGDLVVSQGQNFLSDGELVRIVN